MRKILLGTLVVLGVVLAGTFVARANEGGENGRGNMMDHRSVGSTLEIHINDNGKVLVRGAEVTAVSGNTITVKNTFGSYAMTWQVVTDSNTKFIRKHGGASGVAEVS